MKHSSDFHISFTTKILITFLFIPALASAQIGKEITLEDFSKEGRFTANTIQFVPSKKEGKNYVCMKVFTLRFYETMYTELYLRTPQKNREEFNNPN